MPAELPLVLSAIALAFGALLFFIPVERTRSITHSLGALSVVIASIAPIILDPLVDPARSSGRALWQWSAVGGPAIEASYRVDDLAALAVCLVAAFAGAALAAAGRTARRPAPLAALILATGLVGIATVVIDDIVAGIVALTVLAALTVLGLLAVAPAAATARSAGYLSIGTQALILAALLLSQRGAATFRLDLVEPGAIGADVLLAASLGALLFAGLYPVVSWSVGEAGSAQDPGPLGGLVLMPVGIAATLLLARLVAASAITPTELGLPAVGAEVRLVLVAVILAAVAVVTARSERIAPRPIAVGIALTAFVAALPLLGWSHLVLIAAILTVAYAAVVSLALPDHWEAVRADLGLVVVWVGIATASPLGIAGGIVALAARAAAALATSLRLDPHRDYLALLGGSAAFVVGALAAAIGAATSGDPVTTALGLVCILLLVALELAQVGRRFRAAEVPRELDIASGAVAGLVALLAAVSSVSVQAVARPVLGHAETLTPLHLAALAVSSALAIVLARTLRPLLPWSERAAERSGPLLRALDPVPLGVGTFRGLETVAVRGSAAFGAFERQGGVWLATALIVALFVWASR